MKKIILALALFLLGSSIFAIEKCGKDFRAEGTFHCEKEGKLYFDGKKLDEADLKTFESLGMYGYYKDKNNIYFHLLEDFKENEIKKINQADQKTFQVLESWYAKDKNFVYYIGKKIDGADTKTFQLLKDFYAKDKNNIFYLGNKINGTDQKTFEIINVNFSKDKNSVYFNGTKIDGIDSKTFNKFRFFIKDKNGIYLFSNITKKIEGIDLGTFKIIEEYDDYGFYKDKNFIYTINKELNFTKFSGIDTETFQNLNLLIGYSKDKNNVYYQFKKIDGADSKTFKSLGYSYFQDKNFIYRDGKKLDGVNSKTFKVFENGYAKNDNFVYFYGKIINGADGKSFKVLNFLYSKDKNFVYFYGKKLEGSDGKTFEAFTKTQYDYNGNEFDGKDKNQRYLGGKIIK